MITKAQNDNKPNVKVGFDVCSDDRVAYLNKTKLNSCQIPIYFF